MGNRYDGKSKESKGFEVENKIINRIKEMEEKGHFSEMEQDQFLAIMKAANQHGGLKTLGADTLKELDHIVKVLSSNGDKSKIVSEEVNNIIANIKMRNIFDR